MIMWQQMYQRIMLWKLSLQGEDLILSSLASYRYASSLLTSAYYLATTGDQPWLLRLGVVLSLLAAALLTQKIYQASWDNKQVVGLVVLLETSGIVLLLIPTGGVDSVFIWYAINPVLIAATNLSPLWSFLTVAGLLVLVGLLSRFTPGAGITAAGEMLLILLLITGAARMLALLVRVVNERNDELHRQRQELARALELRATLHDFIAELSNADVPAEMAQLAVSACHTLVGAKTVVFYKESQVLAQAGEPLGPDAMEHLHGSGPAASLLHPDQPDDPLVLHLVSATNDYGKIVIFGVSDLEPVCLEALSPIVDLTIAAFERLRLQELNQQLMIRSEQQRIAGELHDSVAQQLFNISAASYALYAQWQQLPRAAVESRLLTITQTAQQAARDLRVSIYGLGFDQEVKGGLAKLMSDYLEQLKQMHNIDVVFHCEGNLGDISQTSIGLRKALFRILREACGNALRHGQCTALQISLLVQPEFCQLTVADNGTGFDPHVTGGVRREKRDGGMGLANMRRLAQIFGGTLEVDSGVGQGTVVRCRIPIMAAAGYDEHWLGEVGVN